MLPQSTLHDLRMELDKCKAYQAAIETVLTAALGEKLNGDVPATSLVPTPEPEDFQFAIHEVLVSAKSALLVSDIARELRKHYPIYGSNRKAMLTRTGEALKRLVESGTVRETTGNKRYRRYAIT